MAFGLDVIYCIILMAVLTGIYVVLGAILQIALNDLIQGLIMIVSIIAIIFVVINSKVGDECG